MGSQNKVILVSSLNWKILAISVNITTRGRHDRLFGTLVEGEWSGMVGMLEKGEADMALAPLTYGAQRHRVIDYLWPLAVETTAVIIR